jgi:hypothetical protein
MLFRRPSLDGIRQGTVTLAFRRWRRPTVREGGTLMTAVGKLHIGVVTAVALETISDEEALRAGHAFRAALLDELNRREDGDIYRIELGTLEPDPRLALRDTPAEEEDLQAIQDKLKRMDLRASGTPWTHAVLELLRVHPGIRAGDLCDLVGQEKAAFKANVRKLKNLGLTESLGTGYRLSLRGTELLKRLLIAS